MLKHLLILSTAIFILIIPEKSESNSSFPCGEVNNQQYYASSRARDTSRNLNSSRQAYQRFLSELRTCQEMPSGIKSTLEQYANAAISLASNAEGSADIYKCLYTTDRIIFSELARYLVSTGMSNRDANLAVSTNDFCSNSESNEQSRSDSNEQSSGEDNSSSDAFSCGRINNQDYYARENERTSASIVNAMVQVFPLFLNEVNECQNMDNRVKARLEQYGENGISLVNRHSPTNPDAEEIVKCIHSTNRYLMDELRAYLVSTGLSPRDAQAAISSNNFCRMEISRPSTPNEARPPRRNSPRRSDSKTHTCALELNKTNYKTSIKNFLTENNRMQSNAIKLFKKLIGKYKKFEFVRIIEKDTRRGVKIYSCEYKSKKKPTIKKELGFVKGTNCSINENTLTCR